MTTAQIKATYRGDVDVRELYKDVAKYQDWKLTYTGTVLFIEVDSATGYTTVQVQVPYDAAGDEEVLYVVYDHPVDTTGIEEQSPVVIWGRPLQMFTFTNALGGQVSQPLLAGDYIAKG